MFRDRARIRVKAGRGGDGGLSFRREKFVPKGGPDGGDGGRGGDIVLVADADLRDLSAFRAKTVFDARRGGNGRGTRKHGADGDDIVLTVPVGTQVTNAEDETLVADFRQDGMRIVVARGGGGGRGNSNFATPTRQTPRYAETGMPGEGYELELHLKLMADAACAGLPNAGKSSLLRRISNAKPKVADYPFTTLAPMLGTVDGPDGRQLTVADVPGLIEGASEGIGLGHEFLAHLERARLLLHVIDASEGDADERYGVIDRELAAYGAGLGERPQLVVLNKSDLASRAGAVHGGGRAHRGRAPHLVRDGSRDRRAQGPALHALPPACRGGRARRGGAAGLPRVPPAPARAPPVQGIAHGAGIPRRRHRARGRGAGSGPAGRGGQARLGGRDRRRGHDLAVSDRVGIFGGAFDPPHVGHVALAREAVDHFGLDRLLIRVVADPGHKEVDTAAEIRLRLAELAFAAIAEAEVSLDPFARTVDSLEALGLDDPVFLLGADELVAFPTWTRPDRVLELARIGAATRPGTDLAELERIVATLPRPDRIELFPITPLAVSSSDIRDRVAASLPIDGLVAAAVAAEIGRLGLYRGESRA